MRHPSARVIVAIAIERPSRRILHLPDVWKSWNPDCARGNHELLIALREEDSSPLFLSPQSNAPHTLIAGSTGSGKSVLMQNIILGIACTNTPEQARISLIDPKLGVDCFASDGLSHLEGGIIDDQQNAITKLGELVDEMNRRYGVLKENKVANIFDLRSKPDATERLPFLCDPRRESALSPKPFTSRCVARGSRAGRTHRDNYQRQRRFGPGTRRDSVRLGAWQRHT